MGRIATILAPGTTLARILRVERRSAYDNAAMYKIRALVALGVLAAIGAILWLYYNAQPHPLGTLGYDYLNEFPGFVGGLGIIALVIVTVMVFRRTKS